MASPKLQPQDDSPSVLMTPVEPEDIYDIYRCQFQFLTRICASIPADPKVIEAWIKARKARVQPPDSKGLEEISQEVIQSIERGEGEPDQEFASLVFQSNDGVLCMRAATVRAHYKELARTLSATTGRIQGERAFSTKVINGVYHDETEYWLPIRRPDGTPVAKADGTYDKPVHAKGPRGEPINALKQFEYIDPPSFIEFRLKVLQHTVNERDLIKIFSLGATHGYAGERSDGEGRYRFAIQKIHEGTALTKHKKAEPKAKKTKETKE